MQFKFIKSKKGVSFFLFDAVIAALIFFMTIAVILSMRNLEPEIETPKVFGENIMEYLFETEVRAVENPIIGKLMINKTISNPSNTLLEQIIVFYADKEDVLNADFVEIVSESKIPPNYGFKITITNATNTKLIYQNDVNLGSSTSEIRLRRVGITKLNDGSIFGPVIVGVNVWY